MIGINLAQLFDSIRHDKMVVSQQQQKSMGACPESKGGGLLVLWDIP